MKDEWLIGYECLGCYSASVAFTNNPIPAPSNFTTPATCAVVCMTTPNNNNNNYFMITPSYSQHTRSAAFTFTNYLYSTSTLTDGATTYMPTATSIETQTRAVFAAPLFVLEGFTCGCLETVWEGADRSRIDDSMCGKVPCGDGSKCGGTDLTGVQYALYKI